MMRRHEPDYGDFRAEEFFEGRPEKPNEYRDLIVLWEEVRDTAADAERALTESTMPPTQAVLALQLALSSYALRQGTFINRAILEKYPGFCPYCQYRECVCRQISAGQMERNLTPPRDLILGHIRPETAQRMIIRIYSQANADRTLEQLWSAVAEELQEIEQWIQRWHMNSSFLDQLETQHFKFELADAMARIYVLLNRLGIDMGNTLSGVGGGPPYRGTRKPTIVHATLYTPLPKL